MKGYYCHCENCSDNKYCGLCNKCIICNMETNCNGYKIENSTKEEEIKQNTKYY